MLATSLFVSSPQGTEPADVLVAALGLAGSRNLGFPPEPRLSGAGELGRRGEAVPYNGAGHWCKYADLRRAAAKHVDDADAPGRASVPPQWGTGGGASPLGGETGPTAAVTCSLT